MSAGEAENLVAGRECGDCRVCCQIFGIDEPSLQKEAGVLCPNVVAAGCAIYAARPHTCRVFHCAWRQTEALPEAARPDRLGVIFGVTGRARPKSVFDNVSLVAAAVSDPASHDQPAVRELIEQFSHSALPIHLRWRDEQWLVHPAPDLAGAIEDPDFGLDQDLIEQGRAWLARYAPLARGFARERAVLPPGY